MSIRLKASRSVTITSSSQPKSLRARGWCFTINNYVTRDIENMKILDSIYRCYGLEVAPTTGTKHMQCFAYYKNPVPRSRIIVYFPRAANVQPIKGTPEQNIAYCSKEGQFTEYGERPAQGKRNDLIVLREAIVTQSAVDVATDHFSEFLRYGKMFDKYKQLRMTDRNYKPIIMWIYGPSGTGKTLFATKVAKTFYVKDGTQWWDGYEQQDAIIIDDFDGKWPFRDLLRLLDRYPYQGQVKGGYVKINSPYIIITCDRHYESVFLDKTDHELSQLQRRFDLVLPFGITSVQLCD